ncbi:MAG: PAS domain-containing protein, partial [Burkholderiales bacterium]
MTDSSDIHEGAQESSDSEALFRAIIEAVPVPLALNDDEGKITYLNGAFVRTLGYTLADTPDLASWWRLAYPDPQYRQWVADSWQKNMAEAKRTAQPFTPMEVRIACKDGTVRTFLVSPASLGKGFEGTHLVILYDISERRASEARYRVLVEMAPEAITVLDVDLDRFVDANPNAERLYECDREELLKHSPTEFYPAEQPDGLPLEESIHAHKELALTGEEVAFERIIRSRDGRLVPCEIRLIRLPSVDRKLIRASMIDITERKAAEARIERLTNLYRALSEVNQAIVRMDEEPSLFPMVCKMAVDFGGMKMAWIGRMNEANGRIEPVVSYG